MPSVISYGIDSNLTLDLPPDVLIADCVGKKGLRAAEVAEAVTAALETPVGFPPLRQATIPGDRVALIVGEGVPHTGDILAAIVRHLLDNTDPEEIDVVFSHDDRSATEAEVSELLSPVQLKRIRFVEHDPRERTAWAYVAATKDGEPVYLNRAIVDADFVVPVGCLRPAAAPGYCGVWDALFPRFADETAQRRFRDPESVPGPSAPTQQRQVEDEVGWLLGVQFTVQVIPGAGGDVVAVLAGHVNEVAAHGRGQCDSALTRAVPQRAQMVVATIDGGPRQQTWDNFARALAAASRVASHEGVIAVCSDLADNPGPGLQCLSQSETAELALRTIGQERPADAIPAAWLSYVLQERTVFLLSRLDESIVEDLGMAYLANGEDLGRLSQQFASCVILRGAHQLVPAVAESQDDSE